MNVTALRAIVAAGLLMTGGVRPTGPSLAAQAQEAQPAGHTATVTTAVLVDVVVRDRRGRPVTDLAADDFEVREDGTVQAIGSFTRVARGDGIAIDVGVTDSSTTLVSPPASGGGTDAGAEVPRVTALVFDGLSATALALCQRAALEYLPRSTSDTARVAVFSTEPAARMLQGFTDHPALARQAVNALMPAGSTMKEQQAEQQAAARRQRDALENQAATATSATTAQLGTAAGNIGQLEMQRRLVGAQLRMMNAFEALDRDHRGLATSAALFGVLQTMIEMPGRKTLVFFSEGLPASPALQVQLQSIIETANRLNVTVYAVDATGLRAIATTADARREVEEAGTARLRQQSLLRDDAEEPLTRALERTEDLLRLDSQSGLAQLARSTGGFLVRDTNDIGDAFRRIDEDQRFHYLLTYAPSNQALDGTFRRIDVRVRRPGTRVFARDGYRALSTPPTIPVRASEAPAVAALDAGALPTDVTFGATALAFPDPHTQAQVAIVVRVPTSELTFEEQPGRNLYRGDATVVARLKDARDAVVEQLSQQYQFTGKLDDVAAARQGEILFYRVPRLDPGVYTLETAVLDGVSGRLGGRVSTLTIRDAARDALRVSDVVLVRRTERVSEDERAGDNPLQAGDLLLYPATGAPWSRDRDQSLSFYLRAHAADRDRVPDAEVEIRRGGKVLATLPTPLTAPDADGWLRHHGRLPLAALEPGVYQIAVRLGREERTAFFTVVP